MTEPEPGRANVRLALAWFTAAVLLLLADGATGLARPSLPGQAAAYVAVHRSWSLVLPAAFGLFGALYLGTTPIFPVRLGAKLGWAHLAVMAVGAALTKAPQFALLWGGAPGGGGAPAEAFQVWNDIAAAGAILMAASLLLFGWALVGGLRRKPG